MKVVSVDRQVIRPDWIALDWGGTRLRVWAMGPEGILAERKMESGALPLRQEDFEPSLLRVIDPWLDEGPVRIVACGMIGAREGWAEIPYVPVPTKPADLVPVPVATQDPRLRLSILPGLSQSAPPDVMRGEETQVAGLLARIPTFDGILCLPGTHTKWVHVSAAEVVSFQSTMTEEMFDLLAKESSLAAAVRGEGLDLDVFDSAVSQTLSRPERLAQVLFSVRAAHLLDGTPVETSRAQVSGLLIGAELAAMRAYWLGQQVIVAGQPELADLYARALAAQGVPAERMDADPLTLAGLAMAQAKGANLAS